jgi:hypothetical protein
MKFALGMFRLGARLVSINIRVKKPARSQAKRTQGLSEEDDYVS